MTRAFASLLALSLLLLPCPAQAAGFKAGAASVKITPRENMWMAGYGSRSHAATGLLNDLYAKALVIEDAAGTRVAVITLDLVGIGPETAGPICERLNAQYKLPRANVAICCSHTHSGPVVGVNLRTLHYDQVDDAQRKRIDSYAIELQNQIVNVVGRAIAALAPSELSWGQGTATFATNRRNNKEPDVPRLRAEGKLVGPQDHDVPVLKVTDASGKLTAVLFGYACHATVLDGYDWSSDYPGFAQSELEKRHPGCTALFFAGCGADQNPLPRRQVELASQYGKQLADSVDAVLSKPLPAISGSLEAAMTEVPLELAAVPSREEVEAATKSSDKYIAARARLYQSQMQAGKSLAETYPYPIQVWRLGNGPLWITLGGEVVVDYVLRLKQEHGNATWVAGYSNDVMAYIPSVRVLTEGGYEGASAMVYYSLPSPWAPSVETKIVDAVRGLVQGLK